MGNRAVATLVLAVGVTAIGSCGAGTQLAPSLAGPEWIQIDGSLADIERIIREGVGNSRVFPVPIPAGGGGDFDTEALYVLSLRFDVD